ncbi:MAG: ComF family protein [Clostridia bacterium]|nr:ComF family protein [Clostridia bacterium]
MNVFLRYLQDILFPENFTCEICGAETFDNHLCPRCQKEVTFNNGITCPVCGRKTQVTEICIECKHTPPLFEKAVSALVYEGACVALISKFKNGCSYLKDYFAQLIAQKLSSLPPFDSIVYVPMTDKAERKREYNQAQLLAESISEITGKPVIKNAVIKTKDTPEQKTLTQKERAENLRHCFKVEKPDEIKGKSLLLVDDILTTGATADAVCKRLYKAGAAHVYFATVASVEYRVKTNAK